MEDRTKFADNLMSLFRTIIDHLKAQDAEIDILKARVNRLENKDNQNV